MNTQEGKKEEIVELGFSYNVNVKSDESCSFSEPKGGGGKIME